MMQRVYSRPLSVTLIQLFFFEHKILYDTKGTVPADDYIVPLGKGEIKREGTDVTIVAIGVMVSKALEASKKLSEDGIDVEVVDPRTVSPLDKELILDSVSKTRRVVVTYEECKTGGITAEIASLIGEEGFWSLDSPVIRIAGPDIPVAFNPILENYYIPSAQALIDAVHDLYRE